MSAIVFMTSCRNETLEVEISPIEDVGDPEENVNYSDWSEETHGDSIAPNYSVVFNQDEVIRIDIEISSTNWAIMQSDLASNLGSSGGFPGGGNNTSTSDFDPIWVEGSIKHNSIEWYSVGVRFKGNSSLQSAYQSGNNKLSFKLDFDEFEDEHTDLKNQRFYGFKQLNLNNNYNDQSLMREKTSADLFRSFGLISAQTSFCELYVDHGSGSQYYGLYTIVEEVDDTVLDSQVDDSSGNLYKPDGDAAAFYQGSYDESEMNKKSNEEAADYSDVLSLYSIINSSTRTSNNSEWREELESVLDVDTFLKWLAANTVIQNWDTYGNMTHNYYLYNYNGKLTWVPWDNNESLQSETGNRSALSLSMSEVGSSWPLIDNIIDDSEYREIYDNYVESFTNTIFTTDIMTETYNTHYNLIKEYAYAEESGYSYISSDASFESAVSTLKSHVSSRASAVESYLY